jgi:ABC-2 type transport system ATP-binding protein
VEREIAVSVVSAEPSIGRAVQVERVSYAYGKRQALRDVTFDVARGEIFGLLGPNGGGKTTLFRILATLFPPMGGTVALLGTDVARDPGAIRERIGVVFQSPSLDGKLSVLENLRHHGHLYGLSGRALRERIAESLGRAGLADRAHERVERLSGGLKRRVEIAKGLLHRPDLLILDEPSVGLDPGARRDLWRDLGSLRAERGITVLLTTHLLDEAERCDRLAILDRGALVALGTPDGLRRTIGGDVVTVRAREDAARLLDAVRERFGVEGSLLDGAVRVERPQGAAWVAELASAFPGEIDSVTVSRPTLEDVFVRKTGHRFWDEADTARAPEGRSRARGAGAAEAAAEKSGRAS